MTPIDEAIGQRDRIARHLLPDDQLDGYLSHEWDIVLLFLAKRHPRVWTPKLSVIDHELRQHRYGFDGFESQEHRAQLFYGIGQTLHRRRCAPLLAIASAEAWLAVIEGLPGCASLEAAQAAARRYAGPPPSERPDRIEVLTVMARAIDGRTAAITGRTRRNRKGEITGTESVEREGATNRHVTESVLQPLFAGFAAAAAAELIATKGARA